MTFSVSRRAAIAQLTAGVTLAGCGAKAMGQSGGLITPNGSDVIGIQPEGTFNLYIANFRPIVMLSSGDSLPVPVLFDTGSSGNMIDKSVFKQLGLNKKPNHKSFITDASGTTIETFAADIPDARLSSLPVLNATVDVSDYRAGDEVGILGPEIFRGNSVYLNFPKQAAYVRNSTAVPMHIPDAQDYVEDNGSGLPMIGISIGGMEETMLGLIDTGKDGALSFPEHMIDQLPLVGRPEKVGTATTMFSSVPVYGAKMDAEIKIGSETLVRPDVIFHGNTPKVGMPVLGKQRIWLEPHNQRSWVASERPLDQSDAQSFTGQFGIRTIWAEEDGLHYQKEGSSKSVLKYLGGDQFLFGDSQTELIFRRNEAGAIIGFTLLGPSSKPFEVAG